MFESEHYTSTFALASIGGMGGGGGGGGGGLGMGLLYAEPHHLFHKRSKLEVGLGTRLQE